MDYKNIIFDMGNVLVKLDEEATMKQFAALGLGHDKAQTEHDEVADLIRGMGIGTVSNETFFDAVRRITHRDLSDHEITKAVNAMLLYVPEEKKRKLLEIRKQGYHTYLLSNTIDLHWQYCKQQLFPMGKHTVDDYFERMFLSQVMHKKKPDDEIFQTVIAETSINPEETLFIDDLQENCQAAKRQGLHTFQNKEFNDWLQLF